MSSMTLRPEPPMDLYAERAIDTRLIAWPAQRLTSNDRKGKKLYDSDTVAVWRGLGLKAFRGTPRIPSGYVARVVVYYRQPPGRAKVKDVGNLHPITKALVDGALSDAGLVPDDATRFVLGQDERELLPASHLQIVVQVWIASNH